MRTGDLTNVRESKNRSGLVAAQIRSWIVGGVLEPGAQLPTWSQLEQDLGVGRATLMRAMARLRRDGFVRSDSTRGTYVSARPPHLCRYALAFPSTPQSPGWNRMWWSLAHCAARWNGGEDRHVECYYGVLGSPQSESHQRLLAEVRAERLCGVVFVGHVPEISDAISHWPGLPCVRLGGEGGGSLMPAVNFDWSDFYRRSAERMTACGVRSIALFGTWAKQLDEAATALAGFNIEAPPRWRFALHISTKQTAEPISQLLLTRPAGDRPQGLLVLDDNLTSPVLAGVIAAGIRCPEPLRIVAHANLPCDDPLVMPIDRLGFVTGQLLDTAISLIDAQRRKQPVPSLTLLPAVFETEDAQASGLSEAPFGRSVLDRLPRNGPGASRAQP